MLGLMQDWPLLCHRIIEHAAAIHGTQEVVTRSVEGPIHRTNYAEIHQRALKVSQCLDREGIKLGDRVATIAWNTWRHLEVWYGIMGIGAICHTVNPRLFPDQIAWIINHAQDRVVMVDITFVPVLEKIADKLPSVERYIVLTDKAHMPTTTLKNAVAYEDWIAQADGNFKWKTFDENTAAAMCYTSGTTGDPKGVLYSHRSNVLHALMANTGDSLGANAGDTMLPVVPLFHANSWGIAFSAPSMGTKLVFPGAKLDGAERLAPKRVSAVPANGKRVRSQTNGSTSPEVSPDQLLSELSSLTGADALAAWAHRVLPLKNQLSKENSQIVEEAFATKLNLLAAVSDKPEERGDPEEPREPAAQQVTSLSKPRRERDRNHLRFVATQPCLICARTPSDAHHLKFAERSAMGRKVSDKFTVPICRLHHRDLHRRGNERSWWEGQGINPLPIAAELWRTSHPVPSVAVEACADAPSNLNGTYLVAGSVDQLRETKPISGS